MLPYEDTNLHVVYYDSTTFHTSTVYYMWMFCFMYRKMGFWCNSSLL